MMQPERMISAAAAAQHAQAGVSLLQRSSCRPQQRLKLGCAAQRPDSSSSSSSSSSSRQVPLDDSSRRRLRFGDRPASRPRLPSDSRPPPSTGLLRRSPAADAAGGLAARWEDSMRAARELAGKQLYAYFNWRSDSSKDLLVVFGGFLGLVLATSLLRHVAVAVVEPGSQHGSGGPDAGQGLWGDVYQVCQWVLGQQFPAPDASLGQQVLAVVTAIFGLAAFAICLALVEQLVLDTLEANVKRGSQVYESGHILVLGWCTSQRDVEVIRKVLQQICVAHAPEGGTTVVVLTQRSKLEMETAFWSCLPQAKRHGTKLVFRQGSPLVPSDLRLVAASRAAATVIVSDQARCATEADAQAVRCAILLDELDIGDSASSSSSSSWQQQRPCIQTAMAAAATTSCDELGQLPDLSLLGRHIVVELKTANALPLLKYACSSRILALPTGALNAQRLAKMVKRPVISVLSQSLFNFDNQTSMFIHFFPHLVGTSFAELAFLFPDGIVLGLMNRTNGKARMPPKRDYIVQATDALVIIRPTAISSHTYGPQPAPEQGGALQQQLEQALATWRPQAARCEWQASQPRTTAAAPAATHRLRSLHNNIVPAGGALRAHHTCAHDAETLAPGHCALAPTQAAMPAAAASTMAEPDKRRDVDASAGSSSSSSSSSNNRRAALHTGNWPVLLCSHTTRLRRWRPLSRHSKWRQQQQQQPAHGPGSQAKAQLQQRAGTAAGQDLLGGGALLIGRDRAGSPGQAAALASCRRALSDTAVLVPPEYWEVDDRPEVVLVLGWGPACLMVDLLRELDHGLSALPPGSEIVFANTHSARDSLEQALQLVSLENIAVRHVTADPLQRSSLSTALDVAAFRCCLVLCDEAWVDPDANDANGLDTLDEPSVLRLDSLVMVAQLNVRKLLEDRRLGAINIITQKVATESGCTRFEDRHRLPLGIAVNLSTFAAKLLAQLAANPLMLSPITRLGEDAQLTIADASEYAAVGEVLSFWGLMARCQVTGDVLVGYYRVPDELDVPLGTVVDPMGNQARSAPRVWNAGDGRLKFLVLRLRHEPTQTARASSSSHDDNDIELANTRQAGWVALRERAPYHISMASHSGSLGEM